MPTWRSGDGSRVVAPGDGPEPRGRSRSRVGVLVAAAAMAGLVVGVAVGVFVEERGHLLGPTPSAPPSVAAGAIGVTLETPAGGWDFELPVYNPTASTTDAHLVAIVGLSAPVTSAPAEDVPPNSWGMVPFSLTVNCDTSAPADLRSVRLRLGTAGDHTDATVPLPERGRVLVDYHKALCRAGAPVPPDGLAGVWMVEKVYGEHTGLVGVHLLHFGPDGAFVADPEGGLFSRDTGVRGSYRLRGELLEIDVTGGYGCGRGSVTWRITVDQRQVMTMAWVRGTCPTGETGDVWVARRVLKDVGLPPPQA